MHRRTLFLVCLVCCTIGAPADEVSLVKVGDVWRYWPAVAEPSSPTNAWRQMGFNDASWLSGRSGFSYGYGFYDEATVVWGMSTSPSTYFRTTFNVTNLSQIKWLLLRLQIEDGFVAYLNGHEVLRVALAGEVESDVSFSALATAPHAHYIPEEINLSAATNFLVAGENLLAIQAHNDAHGSAFVFVAELLANFQRGPFIQNASTNSVQVIWHTPVKTDGAVEYGVTPALGQIVTNDSLSLRHVFTLTNLLPGTRYFYRIRSATNDISAQSNIEEFSTLKPSGSLTFAVLGDSGLGSIYQYRIAEQLAASDFDLVLHVGDVIYPQFSSGLADLRCLSVYRPHMRRVPYYFAIGNHDLFDVARAGPFLDAFYLPTNDLPFLQHANAFDYAATSPEHFYSFDHGDAHFVTVFQPYVSQYLLTRESPQYAWLTNDLARSTKPWKFMFFHVPVAGSGVHRFDDQNLNGFYDQTDVANVMIPLAQRYGVQMIFSGHEHSYERLNPIAGVHSVVTGGGGVLLRGLGAVNQFDPASRQFWSAHHYTRVTIKDDELELEAVDLSGTVFDAMNIRRTPRPRQLYQATWHTADLRRANIADGDGNFVDQRFELVGRGLAGLPGAFSNPGRLFVNNDRTNLYLGLDRLMAYSSNSVMLFVESPRSSGVSRLDGLGNGILDPEREGADGLDFLHNLSFTNFSPTLGCILGDEFGDGQAPSFMPTGMVFNTGQGIFRLASGFPDVPGSELQQFNRSPQTTPVFGEASADFVEMTIPLAELGGTRAGDVIKLGVVIAGAGVNTNAAVQSRDLDFSFIGYALHGSGFSNVVLEGLAVQLAVDPDPDSDGLTTAEEEALGTNPANGDSDGDGLPDGWEVRHGLNPLDAGGGHGGGGDLDSDGLSNYGEYLAGTDPQDATSALSMRVSFSGTNMLRLSWQAVPGKKYQIEVSESAAGIFAPLPTANSPRVAQSSEENVVESLASGSVSRFYRVRLVP